LRLNLKVPLPSLEALLLRYAATVLPALHLESSSGTPLRQHPMVAEALKLGELMQLMEAFDGKSPQVAAGASYGNYMLSCFPP
jgi:hypothetical protein